MLCMNTAIHGVSDRVNTPRIRFFASSLCVSDERSARLRAARAKAGYESATAAAEAFGWKAPGYRHHENGTRTFGLDAARKYGRAFKVKPGWLLCMPGIDDNAPTDYVSEEKLIVGGSVAAGVWREDEAYSEVMEIETPAPVPNAKRYGYVVEGRSMDLDYPPGTVLDCISIFANGVEPEHGDHVIVRRTKPDGLREVTVKEFQIRDGEFYLAPRSTLPEFREAHIGTPTAGKVDGDQIEVVAFVVGSIPPRALRLLDRLGKIRRP